MSNLVSPRTISLYSKQPSLRDETKSAKSEISLAPKSPTKKLLLLGSREIIDTNHLSPKKIAATPIVWPSQPQQQLNDKSVASSLNTNRETEAVSLKKNQISRKKKGKSALDDRKESAPQLQTLTLNKKYVDDYSSLIMCFPERIDSLSSDKRTPHDFFNPFSDLVKSTMNKHDGRLLENILEEDLMIKSAREGGDRNVDKRDLMKKVLEFNKIQKSHYLKQTAAEKKHILLPLIKQVKEKNKHIPPVRVLPSRRLWEDNAPVEVVQDNKNAATTAQSPQQGSLTSKRAANNPSSNNALTLNTSASQTTANHSKKVSQSLKAYEEKIDIGIPLYAFKAMRVFWAYNSSNDTTWKPETREGHTFTTVGKVIVLYGGLSAALLEEVTIYDPAKGLWEKPKVTGDIPLSGRHGHTSCEYKKSMIIFGGEHQFNPTLSIRECLNDTRMFIPEKNEWKHMRTHNQINPRRHHAAATHDHLMWVYGGINNEGKYMKDLWALNLRNYTWEKIEAPGDKESGIAFHTLTACYVDRSSYANKEKRTYEEGMYVFGGKNSEGKILGTLKVCSAEGKVYQWSYPITKGNPPTPRYNHTTLFYEPLGLLVVYGGRNDSLYESMNDICLNDIRILNLEQMVWIQTTSYGDVPKVGRCRHGAAAFGTKMLIFGGVEFQKYANEEVKSVEIHQSKVKNIIHMDPDAEASGDRSKSRNESLPPILKDTKRNKKDHILISHQASLQQPKAILSYLPIPFQRPFGEEEDTAPRSFSNLSPPPMDRSTENMSRTGQL